MRYLLILLLRQANQSARACLPAGVVVLPKGDLPAAGARREDHNTGRKILRHLFAGLILSMLLPASQSASGAEVSAMPRVPHTTDLRADAALARQRGVPLLVMFSLKDCPYCMVVREEFLDPMRRNRDYDSKVLMRILDMEAGYVTDFDGRRVEADALAVRYGASVAPTVVLVDHQGKMLSERLLGLTTPDFYGGYLDAAIDESLRRLRKKLALQQ